MTIMFMINGCKLVPTAVGRHIFPLRTLFRPEATGEEATVLSIVSEQLQGELGVLDVAVRQQQQVPDAARWRQQAERSQGTPQLSASP